VRDLPPLYQKICAFQLKPELAAHESFADTRRDTRGMSGAILRKTSKAGEIRTTCGCALQTLSGPINGMFFASPDSILSWSPNGVVREIKIALKAERKLQVASEIRADSKVINVEQLDSEKVLVARQKFLEVRSLNGLSVASQSKPQADLCNAKIFGGDKVALVTNGRTELVTRSIANEKNVSTFSFGSAQVIHVDDWPDLGLISACTDERTLVLLDPRLGSPVMERPLDFETVVSCSWLKWGRCVIRSSAGFAFCDLRAFWSPTFLITRNTDAVFRKGKSLVLCDQTGTFTCDPESRSYSLFDCSRGSEISVPLNWVILPVETELSLHGHVFPVTAGCLDGEVCATGDLSGAIHLWSPWRDRLVL
jgi:hypothetical protein